MWIRRASVIKVMGSLSCLMRRHSRERRSRDQSACVNKTHEAGAVIRLPAGLPATGEALFSARSAADAANPERASLDFAGAQPLDRLFMPFAGDGDVGAGGEDIDLADRIAGQSGIAGERPEQVTRT